MSETKHTPGPFEARGDSIYQGGHLFARVSFSPYVNYNRPDEYKMTIGEGDANVRLYAAAPELLAALKDVQRWMSVKDPYLPKVNSAIAKAEGKE